MEQIKTPLYKRKILVIPLAMVMMITLISAAVLFATSHATVTVTEALNVTTLVIAPTGYAGDTIEQDITIDSLSSGNIPIEISWIPGSNLDLVDYTYTGPNDTIITPGSNIVTLTWDVASGSPNGNFEGDITLTRI